jgi:MFS family permease
MQKLLTVILACLGMVGALAIDTYLPSMPAIGAEFAVGPVAVQQTLSVFLFTFAFMMLFYGTLSDSFGRRPVILTALTVYTLASIGAAWAPSFGWLLVFRALQGLSAGAGSVIGQAIVQDRFAGAQAQRMMSHIMMVFGLAPAIAPILGGWLHVTFGWRSSFVFLAVFGALLILVCLKFLPESLPREKRQVFHPGTIGRNYVKVLRHPQFVLLSLALGLAFSGLSLYIGSASNFVMVILGLPETAFAWMFIPLVGGMVIGSAWGADPDDVAGLWRDGAGRGVQCRLQRVVHRRRAVGRAATVRLHVRPVGRDAGDPDHRAGPVPGQPRAGVVDDRLHPDDVVRAGLGPGGAAAVPQRAAPGAGRGGRAGTELCCLAPVGADGGQACRRCCLSDSGAAHAVGRAGPALPA